MTQKVKVEEMLAKATEKDWSRLAAFIDGEGCIYINRQKARKSGWSPRYFLSVMVTNTAPALMKWLADNFGGSVYFVKSIHRPIMRWQMNECLAEEILRGCLPYFIIKRQQAELGLAFRDLKKKQNPRRTKVLATELVQREAIAASMRQLNSNPEIGLLQ